MKKPARNDVVLELHIPDFRKAKSFYKKLGFKVVWERELEGFKGDLVMKRWDSILCFRAGNKEVYNHPYFKQFSKAKKELGWEPKVNFKKLIAMLVDANLARLK